MHRPARSSFLTLVVALAAALCTSDGQRALGQGADGRQPREASSADVLRTRGVSAWRSYVWTLDRARLLRARSDLMEAQRMTGGDATFTQIYLIAYSHLAAGDTERGSQALQEARGIAPDFAGLALLDAFVEILAGRREQGIAVLDTYIERVAAGPLDAAFGDEFNLLGYLHRGVQSYEIGNYDGATDDLERVLDVARRAKRKPPDEAVLRLALAHQMLAEFPAAGSLVRRQMNRDPANASLYYNMGLLAGTQEQLEEARRWHERALSRRRSFAEPHIKLAFLAWKQAPEDLSAIARMRLHLDAYRVHLGPTPTGRSLADLESGEGTYWREIATLREDAGDDEGATRAYARATDHFRRALGHEPGCMRAISSLIQIGYQLQVPDEELAPYQERERAIRNAEEGAPREYRSTFC